MELDDFIVMRVANLIQNNEGTSLLYEPLIANLFNDFFKASNILADNFKDKIKLTCHCVDFNNIIYTPQGFGDFGARHSSNVDAYENGNGVVCLFIINGDSESLNNPSFH